MVLTVFVYLWGCCAFPCDSAIVERFRQQTLSSYTVTFSPRCVISVYYAIALVFIPLGAAVIAGSSSIQHSGTFRYDDMSGCDVGKRSSENITKNCLLEFNVKETIRPPSYLYYVVTNMYQNARQYVKSRSDVQLQGKRPRKRVDVMNCDPALYRPEIPQSQRQTFNLSQFLNPCGLTALSRFNDTLTLCRDDICETTVQLGKKGIAWRTDRNDKFGPGKTSDFTPETNALLTDEDFIVWMRLSAFTRVEKLYGIIREELQPGTYYMRIESRYPVEDFKGQKLFFISNTKWFGARNHFLGAAYLTAGLASLLIATLVLVAHVLHPRRPAHADPDLIRRELAKLNVQYALQQ